VLVGAMRPGNALSADGPGNLVEAVRVAADPASRDRGVLVVLNDTVHDARSVRKARAAGVDAFRSFPAGPVGIADAAATRYFAPAAVSHLRGRFALPATGPLPKVAILYAHADMDLDDVARQLDGAAGAVLAGVGNGNAPGPLLDLLAAAARNGVAVVRATRVGEGFVDRNVEVDDDRLGFVAARDLNPQKSRLLLQLLLANGTRDATSLQAAFDPD
jgi:L-asparaginase